MTILTGNGEFGVALCKALGIDGQSVRSIELRVVVGEAVRVNIVRFVRDDEGDELVEALEHYTLVADEPESQEPSG